ncbi:MAG: prepilin peptidase [Actinobacteria bacterium]|nr:prepilin peptidase [Actinomycetota bacterium]MCI0544547.1 prepilin peptidase [Actinomycetota bacterium]
MVAVAGAMLGLVAHDLAVSGLTADRPLRPLIGVCPECGERRGWHRFRCPRCGRGIQREPVVAVTGGLVAVSFFLLFGWDWELVPYLGFLTLTMALLVTDLEQFRIVDRLNLRGTALLAVTLAIVSFGVGATEDLVRGLLGALVYFAGASALWLLVRGKGFGAGDVKLAPQLGLFTAYVSWGTLGWAVFAMAMIGGVLGVAMLALGAARMKTELPYGPPMIMGAWLALALSGPT